MGLLVAFSSQKGVSVAKRLIPQRINAAFLH